MNNDTLLNHNEDCQRYNADMYPDALPQILDCVCELMENVRKTEENGENQMEMERGN